MKSKKERTYNFFCGFGFKIGILKNLARQFSNVMGDLKS